MKATGFAYPQAVNVDKASAIATQFWFFKNAYTGRHCFVITNSSKL